MLLRMIYPSLLLSRLLVSFDRDVTDFKDYENQALRVFVCSPIFPLCWLGFPTIKFKRAGTTEFLDYSGDRSLESLIEYIVENSNNPLEFDDEESVEGVEEETVGHDEL